MNDHIIHTIPERSLLSRETATAHHLTFEVNSIVGNISVRTKGKAKMVKMSTPDYVTSNV